jgi:hypothetical protein
MEWHPRSEKSEKRAHDTCEFRQERIAHEQARHPTHRKAVSFACSYLVFCKQGFLIAAPFLSKSGMGFLPGSNDVHSVTNWYVPGLGYVPRPGTYQNWPSLCQRNQIRRLSPIGGPRPFGIWALVSQAAPAGPDILRLSPRSRVGLDSARKRSGAGGRGRGPRAEKISSQPAAIGGKPPRQSRRRLGGGTRRARQCISRPGRAAGALAARAGPHACTQPQLANLPAPHP